MILDINTIMETGSNCEVAAPGIPNLNPPESEPGADFLPCGNEGPPSNASSVPSTGLSTKRKRKLARFQKFVEGQDWRPGVTKQEQTYRSFLRAANLKIPGPVATEIVVDMIEKSRGELVPDKIKRQLLRAYQYIGGQAASETGTVSVATTPKPVFCPEALERVAGKLAVDDIVQSVKDWSPLNPEQVDSIGFLSHVFGKDEKVLVFSDMKSQGEYVWSGGSDDLAEMPKQGKDGVWYLVNPVDGQFHLNPREGKRSRRSEESITDFRHLVLESDVADEVQWLKALVQFPLKIVAIYRSGGRSIHALLKVSATSKKDWDNIKHRLKRPLITLGADQQAMSAVRLSRLPQAWRGDKCQELLFLDPRPDGLPICGKEPRDAAKVAPAKAEAEVADAL